ncbi:polysaccharide pyruvyl transferase family protein [Slackia sp.]|uniref:polysaccharide pyruvyl transferase family protein n=1 Tax=Slackia sp. TaxID=2049041 RepID=UPI00257CEFA5|nr:polysaccharide pyruvyl transferase family protein [Slackia sp.]MBS6499612.1 polysaccharide pyruvyl transferase family protein [Slackia sp.]
MKRALVFYLYSANNAGDMAICLGTIAYLKSKGFRITMVSRFDALAPEYAASRSFVQSYYPDVVVEPGVFRLNRGEGKVSLAMQYASGALKCALPGDDKRIVDLVNNCDVVFFNGGNLLRCASLTDRARLQALFYPIKIAGKRGKPCICLPQSTATIGTSWIRYLGKELSVFDKIYIREAASFEKLRALYPDVSFVLCTDMAFFMDDLCARESAQNSDGRVAIVVRGTGIGDIGTLAKARREEMQGAVVDLVKSNLDRRYLITVQTQKDRELSAAYYRELTALGVNVELVEEHDPFKLLKIYRGCDLTLSMRLHACILSVRAGTPVIGFFDPSWGLKNQGVMEDYRMGCVFDSFQLEDEFLKVASNRDRLSGSSYTRILEHRAELDEFFKD